LALGNVTPVGVATADVAPVGVAAAAAVPGAKEMSIEILEKLLKSMLYKFAFRFT